MLRMTVEGVAFDHQHQTVVILKDWEGSRLLPIWIGASEAKAIALELESTRPGRPLSHDLMLTCIAERGAKVTRVVINDLQESTFYATIDVDTPEGIHHIDARPSDAIALAVRAKCPVFVDGGALTALVEWKEMGVEMPDGEEKSIESSLEAAAAGFAAAGATEGDAPAESDIARFKRLLGDLDLQE